MSILLGSCGSFIIFVKGNAPYCYKDTVFLFTSHIQFALLILKSTPVFLSSLPLVSDHCPCGDSPQTNYCVLPVQLSVFISFFVELRFENVLIQLIFYYFLQSGSMLYFISINIHIKPALKPSCILFIFINYLSMTLT